MIDIDPALMAMVGTLERAPLPVITLLLVEMAGAMMVMAMLACLVRWGGSRVETKLGSRVMVIK